MKNNNIQINQYEKELLIDSHKDNSRLKNEIN